VLLLPGYGGSAGGCRSSPLRAFLLSSRPDRPEPLEPGRPERFQVVLGTTSHVFAAGHRLQFIPIHTACRQDFRAVRQTVFHDPARPTRLLLSVVP
jgi:predicted acyl esterase